MDAKAQIKVTFIVLSIASVLGYSLGFFSLDLSQIQQSKPRHIQTKDKRDDGGTGTVPHVPSAVLLDTIKDKS
ncbi:unnamed protein product [Pieris brassicae]|uniref:Uncharacterized protein n=1 Tax=Pieris brassicae TaxID=7116 RepID=A0A9P0TFA1_PIEBR|nr:unnamed protein product [Pieris brassicae]